MSNLACNRASRRSPYEGLGMMIAVADVFADRAHQLADAAEGPSPDALVCDFREKAFHQVQPRSSRGGEVAVIAGVSSEPVFHGGMRVGTVIIQNEMDIQPTRDAALDVLQKTQKLLVAVARHAIS